MIEIKAESGMTLQVLPTLFPDGTSQVWKLPNEITQSSKLRVVWRFENERELMDIASLGELLATKEAPLHIPYFPYARQDKPVDNLSTFNLRPFCKLLTQLPFKEISGVDVHNPEETRKLLPRFVNVSVASIQRRVIEEVHPHWIVFPDAGARMRYPEIASNFFLTFKKTRDQSSGKILGHELSREDSTLQARVPSATDRFLIIDDICDGGATFVGIARELQAITGGRPETHLFVTHGIFSKGRETLEREGLILRTTNSLPKNPEGYDVCQEREES